MPERVPLHQAPEVLKAIGMDIALHIRADVIHSLVNVLLFERGIRDSLIAINAGAVLYLIENLSL